MRPIKNLALAAALTLLSATGAVPAGEPLPAPTLTPLPERPRAPEFSLRDADGKGHRLSQHRGKVVLINFWATWCPPCRREMPSMQRAWDRLKGEDFMMLAVNVGEDEDTVFAFSFATGVTLDFPILLDRDSAAIRAWPVRALPTSFILDREGRMVYRAVGGREWDDPQLLEKIRALIEP